MTCTFAVVPAITSVYPAVQGGEEDLLLDPSKAAELRAAASAGIVDVALHGWNHLTNEWSPPPTPSEFRGLSLDEQVSILKRGKEFLAEVTGSPPKIFVPPWNTYDINTLRALDLVGIQGVSANRYAPPPIVATGLKFAPMTVELGGLRAAIELARCSQGVDSIVGVMLHPYDFKESGDRRAYISLDEFERELDWLGSLPDVRVLPISAVIDVCEKMGEERFRANRPSMLETAFPRFVQKTYGYPVYLSEGAAKTRRCMRDLVVVVFWILVCSVGVVVGVVGQSVLSHLPRATQLALLALAPLVAVGLAARSLAGGAMYSRTAMLIISLVGLSIGLSL